MRVAVGLKEILVHVEYESLNFRIIRQYIDKNFTNTLKLTNTIIVFDNPKDNFKKEFFLQWLYASYKKADPQLMPSFKENLIKRKHLPIKIKITDKKEVLSSFKLSIKHLEDDLLIFRINIKNYLMLNYIRLAFRKEFVKKSSDGHAFSLRIDSYESKERLEKLLKRRKILNYPISFVYDEAWMKSFLSPKYSGSNKYQTCMYEDSFIIKSYEILKSTQEDTIEIIKKRYLELIKKFHPDRIFYVDNSKVQEYTEQFQLVQRAFETIKEERKNSLSLSG